ncbi:MAG: DUF3160 domain-containing protein [Petrotogales bacterium]
MNLDKRILGIGIVCLFILSGLTGCIQQPTPPGGGLIIIPSSVDLDNPKYAMASYYSPEEVDIEANVPQYVLPLNLTLVENMETIDNAFNLSNQQKDLLKKNGFVVRSYWEDEDDIVEPYKYLKENNIAIFVTSDTLLHLYHIQFDEILKGIEEREFFDKIIHFSKALFDKSKGDYESYSDGDFKEALRRNVAFFGVALSLLNTPTEDYNGSEDINEIKFKIPDYVENNITEELSYIDAHDGYHTSPIFHYREDYSQYKPRGHYTRSEKLRRYFKAMMWYGRMSFLMKGGEPSCPGCDFLISEKDAKIQTIQASLIAATLPSLSVNDESLEELWDRIYTVTSFFVGAADDLTPYEYLNCVKTIFGSQFNATDLANDTELLELKVKLAQLRSPQIYGGTGDIMVAPPFTKEKLYEVLEKTKGMRLMGQRFIPDSYMFQQLVSPAVGMYVGEKQPFTMEITNGGPARCFPRGLDIMAVLGSERAYEILEAEGDTEYQGINTSYDKQLSLLQKNFSQLNITEWNRNLYFSWIYTLKSLLKEYTTSYPTFMTTQAWLDKQLQTALASWSELRHDTILYGKQSYTPRLTSEPPLQHVGYVEPVPEFYTRLQALTHMTRTGLTNLNVLNQTEATRLQNLETILRRLINISKQELENQELSESDYDFIQNFGENISSIVIGVKDQGKETTIVADVHTDSNTDQVLEEGIGYVDLIIVAYKLPDGRIIAGAGPTFSYYEFKQPMNNRLTDEQWKDMLQNGEEPSRPDWIKTFVSE